MKENIIGREQEIEKLEEYISSRKSERSLLMTYTDIDRHIYG